MNLFALLSLLYQFVFSLVSGLLFGLIWLLAVPIGHHKTVNKTADDFYRTLWESL